MELETFQHSLDTGWAISAFPELDSNQTMIIVFGSPEYLSHPEIIQELKAHYPNSCLAGCSSSGEIFGSRVFDRSLSVAVMKFKHTQVQIASRSIRSAENSYDVGEALALELRKESLKGIMIFSDGLKVNGTQLVQGLNSVLPEKVILTGGLAGDGPRFKETWVIQNGSLGPGFVTAVGLYGDKVHLAHGSKGGWDIFGPERRITRSKDNILYELDGRPALTLYKEYLGEKSKELPASGLLFPLQLRTNKSEEKKIVRTILSVNEEEQSMTFAGDMPEKSYAQLMRANFDRLIEGASEAASLMEGLTPPLLVVAISCVGRRLVLGERTEEETEATLDVLPPGTEQIGFYSYGEISPYVKGSACELHNQTMTMTAICEDP